MEQYTIGALYRELIIDVIPEIDKVIYLDCDIIMNLDIKELWDIAPEDKSLAGVKEINHVPLSPYRKRRITILKCDTENYINAGVLIMNLKKLRETGDFREKSLSCEMT